MKRVGHIIILWMIFGTTFAQTYEYKGLIRDKKTKKPLNEIILVSNQMMLAETDSNGRFNFTSPHESLKIITFSNNYVENSTIISTGETYIELDKLYETIPGVIVSRRTEDKIPIKPNSKTSFSEERFFPQPKNGSDSTTTIIKRRAEFWGGFLNFHNYLVTNFEYPRQALLNSSEGSVALTFTIDQSGYTSDIQIAEGEVDSSLASEAIRLIKESPSWIPAWSGKEKDESHFTITMEFKLNSYWLKKRKKILKNG